MTLYSFLYSVVTPQALSIYRMMSNRKVFQCVCMYFIVQICPTKFQSITFVYSFSVLHLDNIVYLHNWLFNSQISIDYRSLFGFSARLLFKPPLVASRCAVICSVMLIVTLQSRRWKKRYFALLADEDGSGRLVYYMDQKMKGSGKVLNLRECDRVGGCFVLHWNMCTGINVCSQDFAKAPLLWNS